LRINLASSARGENRPSAKDLPQEPTEERRMTGYVHRILRKDGTVVTITQTDGHYDLAVEGKHRKVRPEVAANHVNDPEFEAIVRELKKR
jgi:hypothetical protein